MPYRLTEHAESVIRDRNISLEWVERTLALPKLRNPDPRDLDLEQRFRAIPEFGDRVLRVVVNVQVFPEAVVSVFFDRRKRGKL
jgi:hypothetical protein